MIPENNSSNSQPDSEFQTVGNLDNSSRSRMRTALLLEELNVQWTGRSLESVHITRIPDSVPNSVPTRSYTPPLSLLPCPLCPEQEQEQEQELNALSEYRQRRQQQRQIQPPQQINPNFPNYGPPFCPLFPTYQRQNQSSSGGELPLRPPRPRVPRDSESLQDANGNTVLEGEPEDWK